MHIEIITTELDITIVGFSGTAAGKDYAGITFRLSGKMWQVVKEHDMKNKGKNIWVYEPADKVFAGVEPDSIVSDLHSLEKKRILITKYAYYKHVGPYRLLKQVGTHMKNELNKRGFETKLPYIEIYGHWTNDECALETELLMSLE